MTRHVSRRPYRRPASLAASAPKGFAAGFAAGFTLVEIALVLIVVGLVLGGVFKGQALVDSARVRALAGDLTGIQSAWHAFRDRYDALPGDFTRSATQIDRAAAPGNGNGRLDDARERAGAWQQLALAGFVSGDFDGDRAGVGGAGDVECRSRSCPANPFGGYYKLGYGTEAAAASGPAHELVTGGRIPVAILAELDRKLDDGRADGGRLRVHRAYAAACARGGEWDVASGHGDCAGVLRD